MEIKVSPLVNSNSQALQSQVESRINEQRAVSWVKNYDEKEAPIIKLIRMMKIGKDVNLKV